MDKVQLTATMHNHEPPDYVCPFCRIIQYAMRDRLNDSATDVICHSDTVTAFLALGRWPRNPVDVLIVPNQHFENLYDLPVTYGQPLHSATRSIALALKTIYHCDGVSTRQHNESAGDQDVWHYHVHVTPRFTQDDFYQAHNLEFPEPERLQHAQRLREYIRAHPAQ